MPIVRVKGEIKKNVGRDKTKIREKTAARETDVILKARECKSQTDVVAYHVQSIAEKRFSQLCSRPSIPGISNIRASVSDDTPKNHKRRKHRVIVTPSLGDEALCVSIGYDKELKNGQSKHVAEIS